MQFSKKLSGLLVMSLISACAGSVEYKQAPSAITKARYTHEQLRSPSTKQAAGAALAGLMGTMLGQFGIVVTVVGSAVSQKQGVISYLRQMNNTEMAGLVIEDVTQKRKKELQRHPSWFKNVPPEEKFPTQVNVDIGSGNAFIFPVHPSVTVSEGDVVTILAPSTTHHLASNGADFNKDYPQVVAVRCTKGAMDCLSKSENGLGIVRRTE